MRSKYILSALSFFLLFILTPLFVHAQNISWTGNGDGTSWDDAANWDPESVPAMGDEVIIDLSVNDEYTIEVTQNRTIASLSLDSRDAILSLGADLTVSSSYYQNFSTLTGSGDLAVDGELTFRNGTMSGSGTTFANGDSQFKSGMLDARRFVVASDQTLSRTDSFDGKNGAILKIEENATFDNQTGRYMSIASDSNSPPKIVNHGLMIHTKDRDPTISWTVENHGTILVDSGNHLRLTGQIIDHGGIYRTGGDRARLDIWPPSDVTFNESSTLASNTGDRLHLGHSSDSDTPPKLTISGILNAEGSLKLGESYPPVEVLITQNADVQNLGGDALIVGDRASLSVEIDDPISAGSLSINFEGELSLNSDLTVEKSLSLNNASASFESDHATIVNGSMTWQGGAILGSGTLTAAGGIELTGGAGSSSNVKQFDSHQIVVPKGTSAIYRGNYLSARNGATLLIEEGGVFDFQSHGNLEVMSGSSSPPVIINRGALTKTGGGYNSRINWSLENHSLIESENGRMHLQGAIADSNGVYRATGGGNIDFRVVQAETVFGTESLIEETGDDGQIRFEGQSGNQDVPVVYRINGDYQVRGMTYIEGRGVVSATRLHITDKADSLLIGNLFIDAKGEFRTDSDLSIDDGLNLDDSSSLFDNYGDVTVTGLMTWKGGNLSGSGSTVVDAGLQLTGGAGSSSNVKRLIGHQLVIAEGDTAKYTGNLLRARDGATLLIEEGGVFDFQSHGNLEVMSGSSSPPAIINRGTLTKTDGGFGSNINWAVENHGNIDVQNGRLRFTGSIIDNGGEYLTSGARLDLYSNSDILLSDESSVYVDSDGEISINEEGDFRTDGDIIVDGEFYTETPVRSDSTITLNDPGTIIHGTPGRISNNPDSVVHLIEGGELQGTGFITGDVVSDSGSVHPGGKEQAGILNIQGDFVQRSGGSLDLELGGSSAGDGYDRLDVENAELDGELRLSLINSYSPGKNDVLEPLRWSESRSGSFESLDYSETGDALLGSEYSPNALRIFDGSLPDPPSAPKISVRASAPPFARTDNPIPVNVEITSSSQVAIGILETDNIVIGKSSPSHDCPMDDAYENLKCRMAPFDVVPPEPPEGEEYPFLTYIPVQQVLSQTSSSNKAGRDLLENAETSANQISDAVSGSVSKLTTSRAAFIGSGGFNVGGTASCPASGQNVQTTAGMPGPIMTNESLDRCAAEVGTKILEKIGSKLPGYDCYSLYSDLSGQVSSGFKNNHDMVAAMASNVLGALDCAGDLVPATKAIKLMRDLNSHIRTVNDFKNNDFKTCFAQGDGGGSGGSQTTCVGAIDPNEKLGPQGVNKERYTSHRDSLPYTVFFENKAEATAPAQQVVIFDTLGTDNYEFNSFTFGAVAFGDTSVTTPNDTLAFHRDVDLRPERELILRIEGDADEETGVLKWTFTSLDPETGEPTTDPLAGFLPPNDEAPEGEGSVSYFADLEKALSSGATFGASARIIFDQNEPIDTPAWTNVLDIEPPQSEVNSLDATQDTVDFRVSWSGTDAESGIRSFSMYVSKNGSSYTPWIEDTTGTSAVFKGEQGSDYRFYSIAGDSVGLVEEEPSSADASTTVAGDATSADPGNNETPEQFTLEQNYPNPFNPTTNIRFGLPEEATVTLEVYNTIGQEVATLIENDKKQAGWFEVRLSASDLSSGIYIYRLQTGEFVESKKLTLIK